MTGKQIGPVRRRRSRQAWSEEDVAKMIRMREIEKKTWAAIDAELGRKSGSSCGKYDGSGRAKLQVSKFGGGGRIDTDKAFRERDARKRLEHSNLTAALLGDPLPGRSALDKQRAGIEEPEAFDRRKMHEPRKVTLSTGAER